MDCNQCPTHCASVDALLVENMTLKAKVSNLTAEVDGLKTQVATIEVDRALELSVESSQGQTLFLTNHSNLTLAKQNYELLEENRSLKALCVSLQRQINDLRSEIATVKKTNEDVQLDLATVKKTNEEVQLELATVKKTNEDVQLELATVKQTNDKVIWSMNMREGVKRVCKKLKALSQNEADFAEFVEKNKKDEPILQLTKADVDQVLDYKDELSDYLSSALHQEFDIEIIMKTNEHLKEISDGDEVEFNFAGSTKREMIKIQRKPINLMIALLKKGYGGYDRK